MEKPIADTVEAGERMRDACSAAGVALMVGHAFRRLGASRRMRELIDSGALGEVVLAEANMSLPGSFKPGAWRAERARNPGGADHAARHPSRGHARLSARPGRAFERLVRARGGGRRHRRRGSGHARVPLGRARGGHRELRVAEDALAAAVRERGRARLQHRLLRLAGRGGARRRDEADAERRAGRVRGARHAGRGAR